ncbi:MAG: outer membrane lipoprotein-sorting protein [Candidatus Eremiobacteraeota bacterium]|nr:outer membrane lipoprotein-sorting protein [Candidatus Eremiobacteraeota bacterium]
MRMRKAFSAVVSAAVCGSLLALPAHAQPDPYQIFANARQYWMQQRYPTQLQYQVAVAITEGGKERVEHYQASYDAVSNVVDVDPTSDYERENPVKPSGVNFGLFGFNVNKPLPTDDFLGVPKLRPNYSFGMAPFVPAPSPTPFNSMALVNEIRKEFHDPNPRKTPSPAPAASIPEIATVYAQNREYTITMLGTETVDGHACYHLGLKPVKDPGRYRIREAWIDETTFAPWRLKDSTNFVSGDATSVPWTIQFTDVDGAHYISEEDADAPVSSQGEIYTRAAVRFESIAQASKPPHIELPGGSKETLDEPESK